MWKVKLEEIKSKKGIYGEQINDGASEEDLLKLINSAKNILNTTLPDELLHVLKYLNGLEFNGHILYGVDEEFMSINPCNPIDGLIDLNETWQYDNEDFKKYLFLGENDISWYVYNIETEEYFELDKPSGREMEKYESIDVMLTKLFSNSLN